MAIFDLYSKRQKRLSGDIPDVFIYDNFPNTFRVQLVYLIKDCLGGESDFDNRYTGTASAYQLIAESLRREYGVFNLVNSPSCHRFNELEELSTFILNEVDVNRCVDAIELCFRYADHFARKYSYRNLNDASEHVDNCIEELNSRFKENGIGYRYESMEIIRIDSELIHAEVVKPALRLLHEPGYQGPKDEFLSAYEHYRHRKYKEALNDALKSFESTIKVICNKNGWSYDSRDTAKKLILICINNGLFPSYYQTHLSSLSSLLESGVPTIRNKVSGHGQGEAVTEVDSHIVAYTLHMTASAIVLLVESAKCLTKT